MDSTSSTQTPPMNPMNIGLAEEQRQGVSEILTRVLADDYTLYTKTRKYHWNVVGPQFRSLHLLLEEQYKRLNESTDEVAERIRTLGDHAIGTMAEFLEHTQLQEQSGHYPSAHGMVADLMADHETVIRSLRDDIDKCEGTYEDLGSSDFLTDLLQSHEKMAWMLRAFLEGEGV